MRPLICRYLFTRARKSCLFRLFLSLTLFVLIILFLSWLFLLFFHFILFRLFLYSLPYFYIIYLLLLVSKLFLIFFFFPECRLFLSSKIIHFLFIMSRKFPHFSRLSAQVSLYKTIFQAINKQTTEARKNWEQRPRVQRLIFEATGSLWA